VKERVLDDEDIKFKFYVDSEDNHGAMSVNDVFYIDSDMRRFSEIT